MQGILLIISGLGWTVDLLFLLLELNYWLVSSLISLLLWTIHSILSLPGAIGHGLLHCWEGVLLGLAMLGESSYSLLLGALQATGDLFKGALAGLDGLQLVWNLLCHMVIRSREAMQRGFINIVFLGQNLHCQVWEVLTIASSLTAYLVNTVVNLSLIAIQNVFSAVLSLWISIVNVVFASKELVFSLFSQLSSTAVAMVVLVWAPFQMAVDVLVFCSTGVGTIVFKYVYEFLLLMLLIWLSRMVYRPSPAMRSFQDALRRLYRVVRLLLYVTMNSDIWRRVANRGLHLLRICRAAWTRSVNHFRTREQNAPQQRRVPQPAVPAQTQRPVRLINPVVHPLIRPSRFQVPLEARLNADTHRNQAAQEVRHNADTHRNQAAQVVPPLEPRASTSTSRTESTADPVVRPLIRPSRFQAPQEVRLNADTHRNQAAEVVPPPEPRASTSSSRTETTAHDPWKLLKQQEENRKCVICQDENKTILLLPCRHLCLCAQCTQILMQQPILQRNCPLCRKMILQTLTVYM
ncbi:E3 ubiquitin-protein ligase RNF26 [Hyperolius riggenbachi]|uniref:E3 ubiquitin-protein ligase RNF26 n=1 Tax=Hyperolius riggenbachi TaxID=752182 RepID=UPI0035A2F569